MTAGQEDGTEVGAVETVRRSEAVKEEEKEQDDSEGNKRETLMLIA